MSVAEILARKEPIIYLLSAEESRAEVAIQKHCEQMSPPKPLFRWSCTRGLERLQGGVVATVRLPEEPEPRGAPTAPLVPVLRYAVHQCEEDGVFLLKDVHPFLRTGGAGFNLQVTMTTRALRDAFYELRALGKPRKIVLLSPELAVPGDLEKEVRIQDFPLPTRDDLLETARKAIRRAQVIRQKDSSFGFDVEDIEAMGAGLADAALGLTQVEVEYLLDNLLYVDRRLTSEAPRRLMREKQQIIRKSGVLEFIPAEDLQDLEVGGLEVLLRWLRLRKHVLDNRERARQEFGLRQAPRGVLLAGISGCGKSLVCKKIAHDWGLPLLRLDVGAIFDRWVGASEERMRKALQVAESVAPCILWIDEIEKGFSTGGVADGGTSLRVLATFLVWMQEKKSPVFIAATANDITQLPPELLRPGRFDNRFFVGCPGDQARRQIIEIHLRTRLLDPRRFELDELVKLTFGFTGAEIEQLVLDSAYDAFYEGQRATMDDLLRNLRRTRPLVKSLGRQMQRILEMLEDGRMELASEDTIPAQQLVDRLGITLLV